MPRAVRAFSVLGPIGLLSLVKGDGTRFEWVRLSFASVARSSISCKCAEVVSISHCRWSVATTPFAQRRVSGNLVPANLLNQVIGAIPLLGNILTGVEKGGLFVTQFSMTGSIDEPKTTTNGASLIPGILRDVVSPDWLKREGARILGIEDKADGLAQPVI